MDAKIPMKDKIAKTLSNSETPMHIKEIADNFSGIPESTLRGRLNDNVGKLFDRVGKGLYILKGEKGTVGLINGDARKLDDKFDSNSIDLIISDHAWLDEKSHKGGSRNFATSYDCFKYENEDFIQKHKVLKDGGFLVEFLPEKNANNRKYLREIEDMAEKSGLNYFAEVNITGGNSNIGRKKKFISTAYFFSKGEARKLKIWDEKLAKMIEEGEMKYMKKEYMVDFKKVYSEVLHIEKNPNKEIPILYKGEIINFLTSSDLEDLIDFHTDSFRKLPDKKQKEGMIEGSLDINFDSDLYKEVKGKNINKIVDYLFNNNFSLEELEKTIFIDNNKTDYSVIEKALLFKENDENLRITENFDFRITKKEAEYILKNSYKFDMYSFDIMCKEYGQDDDWVGITSDDINEENELDNDYLTFDIFLNDNNDKHKFINYLDSLNINYGGGENDILRQNFLKHTNEGTLAQFKKYKNVLEKIQELYHYKKNDIMTEKQQIEYDELIQEESNFYNAFNEYITFLQAKDSYKMGTKTILPEFFIGDSIPKNEKRHESQKPINTLEEIILQTTNTGETVADLCAGSFICAEGVINIGNEGKGWRNYIGIEIDKRRVEEAKIFLRNKYKDLRLFTVDDFYNSCTKPDQQLVKSKGGLEQYKKLEVVKNRINTDLKDTLKVSFLQFNLENDDNLTAKNFKSESNRILSIGFLGDKRMNEENRVLTVIANKEKNIFEIVNRTGKIINQSKEGGNLDESLIKLYNTFL